MSAPKTKSTSHSASDGASTGGVAPRPDFDDTIAANRALPLLEVASLPRPPKAYRATDPDTRAKRLRRFSADHRAEAGDALRQVAKRDVKADLGNRAPDGKLAPELLERMTQTGELVSAAQALLTYAREMDQIALSDAFVYLEKMNKHLVHALEDEEHLAPDYSALQKLFAARSDAIAEGMATARSKDQPAAEAAGPSDK